MMSHGSSFREVVIVSETLQHSNNSLMDELVLLLVREQTVKTYFYIHHVLRHWKHPNKACILYFYFTYSIVHKLWLLCPHRNNCLEHVHHLLSLEPVDTDHQSTECPRTPNTITGTNKVHITVASLMMHSNSSIVFCYYLQWTIIGPLPVLRWTRSIISIISTTGIGLLGQACCGHATYCSWVMVLEAF